MIRNFYFKTALSNSPWNTQIWNTQECPNFEDPAMVVTYNINPEKFDITYILNKVDKLCKECPEFELEPEGYG